MLEPLASARWEHVTNDKVADWAREPLIHGDNSFRPDTVIAPGNFPKITDVEHAKHNPIIAGLSAVMHQSDRRVWQAALPAIAALVPDERRMLYNVIISNIPGRQVEVAKHMSIDFSEYASDYGRSVLKNRHREIALDLLQTRFGELFTADHRARVETATARQLERIIHDFAKPDVTLDDVLAPLSTAAKRARKR